jgi:hypothetical protein
MPFRAALGEFTRNQEVTLDQLLADPLVRLRMAAIALTRTCCGSSRRSFVNGANPWRASPVLRRLKPHFARRELQGRELVVR